MAVSESTKDFLTDFLVGISDGLLIPFGLTIGMSRHFSSATIIIVTICVVIISALASALSRYLSSKESLKEEHLDKIVSSLDLKPGTRELIAEETKKTNNEWQLIISEVNKASIAQRSARNIAIGYLSAGIIPVLSFLLTKSVRAG